MAFFLEERASGERGLLPSGFPDRKAPAAEKIFEARYRLTRFFVEKGYALHSPPLLEFADGAHVASPSLRDVFRVTDPGSRETLILRGDVTAQIARMAAAEISSGKAALPLRISYSGKAVRTEADEYGGLRERTQVGLEHIGGPFDEALRETAALLLENLLRERRGRVVFVAGLPDMVSELENMVAHTHDERRAFRLALAYKDRDYAKNTLCDAIDAEWLLGMKEGTPSRLPDALAIHTECADNLCNELKTHFSRVDCRVDPADVHRYPYHKRLVFSVFCADTGRELARGGHYRLEGVDAAGATLFVEDVCL
ncbi:MAG: ATP phosphoribosyltransferase regulatory subunit [Rickettsiales bacterium]